MCANLLKTEHTGHSEVTFKYWFPLDHCSQAAVSLLYTKMGEYLSAADTISNLRLT